ncbi:unnamed protein product, partial [Porites lobata]
MNKSNMFITAVCVLFVIKLTSVWSHIKIKGTKVRYAAKDVSRINQGMQSAVEKCGTIQPSRYAAKDISCLNRGMDIAVEQRHTTQPGRFNHFKLTSSLTENCTGLDLSKEFGLHKQSLWLNFFVPLLPPCFLCWLSRSAVGHVPQRCAVIWMASVALTQPGIGAAVALYSMIQAQNYVATIIVILNAVVTYAVVIEHTTVFLRFAAEEAKWIWDVVGKCNSYMPNPRKEIVLRRDFPDVGSKGYDSKALAKEEKAWDEILTKFFNSQNPNGIKSELSQLQGRWRQLN